MTDQRDLKKVRRDTAVRIIDEAVEKNKFGKVTMVITAGHIVDFKWEVSFDDFHEKKESK